MKPDVRVTMTVNDEKAAMRSIMLQLYGRPAGAIMDAALDKAIEILNCRVREAPLGFPNSQP